MIESGAEQRRTFSFWLRTGRRPTPATVERKFNPYHDPRNGQFTFAPGGPRSLSDVTISYGRGTGTGRPSNGSSDQIDSTGLLTRAAAANASRVLDPGATPRLIFASSSRTSRGGNIRAFHDPMTLEQVFPSLRSAPAGAVVAVADNILDLAGPARALTAELTQEISRALIDQIRVLDPTYRFDSLAVPRLIEGQANQLNNLRFDRATLLLKKQGEARPLQVETLRFMQQTANRAYAEGLQQLRENRLAVRLSKQEALGDYVDQQVRLALRAHFARSGIDAAGAGPVRVNRRENSRSSSDLTYRRPDARVGRIAYDVTLSRKSLNTPQVRGFFRTDFRPTHVIIVRPTQLGAESSYIIFRPSTGEKQ